jgi:hypothetical protein
MQKISLIKLENRIKRKLSRHLKSLGFLKTKNGLLMPSNGDKATYRNTHENDRTDKINNSKNFVQENFESLLPYFASGRDINPSKICPKIELIDSGNSTSGDLFRLASLTWSIPVSQGYGRRMRFLVWDQHNGKLIGIIALGDPVFNLKARDDLIGWSGEMRKERLVNMMDAYVLGALPPYNMLLGGKLVACLIRSKEISNLFSNKYKFSKGIISQKKKSPILTVVSTSSALGRSSVYNRLKLGGVKYFEPIGFTSGWGHFHVPDDLFEEMRIYLRRKRHKYADENEFGSGPNWKIRVLRRVLEMIGMNSDVLRHGLYREVFLCKLASNAEMYLRGETKKLKYENLLSLNEISSLALERWIIPRSQRVPTFKLWGRRSIEGLIHRN